jgi:hypothetical protein
LVVLPLDFSLLRIGIHREDHSLKSDQNYEIEAVTGIDDIHDGVAVVGRTLLARVEGDGACDVMYVLMVSDDPPHLLF